MWLALDTATDRASVALGEPGRGRGGGEPHRRPAPRGRAAAHDPGRAPACGRRARRVTGLVAERWPGELHRTPRGRVGGEGAGAGARAPARGPRPRCWCARPAWPGGRRALVLAVADALRGEVYAAAYRFEPDRMRTELAPSVSAAGRARRSGGLAPDVLVGEAPRRGREALERWIGPAGHRSTGGLAARRAAARTWSDCGGERAGRCGARNGSRSMAGRPKRRRVGRWPMDAPYRIRSAVPADAAPLVAIERRCFSDPWSEASFREALDVALDFRAGGRHGRGHRRLSDRPRSGRHGRGPEPRGRARVSPPRRGPARSCAAGSRFSASGGSKRSFSRCGSPTARRRRST